jgi:signal transduction histidine kinase
MDDRLSVLVVDDESIIRKRVCLLLSKDFCVDEAVDVRTGRAAAKKGYDAILLDIMMPDGNGIDLCREIKAEQPHATVVISSSMESVDAWNQAFQAGADGYLEKRELLALDPKKIGLTIRNLVESNRLWRQAEETNQRQVELLSVLSHDVRTPFQTLLGTIELLRKGAVPDTLAGSVETLYHCAKDQLAFINSLLELLRLESGFVAVRRFPLDVNLPVNQSAQGLQILARQKDIALRLDLDPDLPKIQGDIARLSQVLNNVLSNAIKFTPRNGNVSVATRSETQGTIAGVEICVRDTGIGINPEEQKRIFQRFHRGREQGTEGERGTGLGLSICKEIVLLHGGTIEAIPELPCGTLVRIWLPAEFEQEGAGDCLPQDTKERRSCVGDERMPANPSREPLRTGVVQAAGSTTKDTGTRCKKTAPPREQPARARGQNSHR